MRGRPFPKGRSPNPGGRPKVAGHVRDLAREHTAVAVATLVYVMQSPKSPAAARVAACNALLDRGYGRPGPTTTVSFRLPELNSASDACNAMAAIVQAMARGELMPVEAAELSRLVEAYVKAIECTDFDRRLQALEERDAETQEA